MKTIIKVYKTNKTGNIYGIAGKLFINAYGIVEKEYNTHNSTYLGEIEDELIYKNVINFAKEQREQKEKTEKMIFESEIYKTTSQRMKYFQIKAKELSELLQKEFLKRKFKKSKIVEFCLNSRYSINLSYCHPDRFSAYENVLKILGNTKITDAKVRYFTDIEDIFNIYEVEDVYNMQENEIIEILGQIVLNKIIENSLSKIQKFYIPESVNVSIEVIK